MQRASGGVKMDHGEDFERTGRKSGLIQALEVRQRQKKEPMEVRRSLPFVISSCTTSEGICQPVGTSSWTTCMLLPVGGGYVLQKWWIHIVSRYCFVCRAGIPPSLPLDGGHLSHLLGNLEPMFRHDFFIEICFHAQLTVIQLWEMKSWGSLQFPLSQPKRCLGCLWQGTPSASPVATAWFLFFSTWPHHSRPKQTETRSQPPHPHPTPHTMTFQIRNTWDFV